jgi:hypothetical protein
MAGAPMTAAAEPQPAPSLKPGPRLTRGRIAALIMGAAFVGWGFALFFGFPHLYGRKLRELRGQDVLTVTQQLGPPTREWKDDFACDPAWPCQGSSLGGTVLLYAEPSEAWYLYFDTDGKFRKLEPIRAKKRR